MSYLRNLLHLPLQYYNKGYICPCVHHEGICGIRGLGSGILKLGTI